MKIGPSNGREHLLRQQSGQKMKLKEKFVEIYDMFLRVRSPHDGDHGKDALLFFFIGHQQTHTPGWQFRSKPIPHLLLMFNNNRDRTHRWYMAKIPMCFGTNCSLSRSVQLYRRHNIRTRLSASDKELIFSSQLQVNADYLSSSLRETTEDQLLAIKDGINSIFLHAVQTMRDPLPQRRLHAMQVQMRCGKIYLSKLASSSMCMLIPHLVPCSLDTDYCTWGDLPQEVSQLEL